MSLRVSLELPRRSFSVRAAFELPAGEVLGLHGPNGAGKSSLLRAVAGLEAHARGEIRCDGIDWLGARTRVPAHRRSVSAVLQHEPLFPHWNVEQQLRAERAFGRPPSDGDWCERVFDALALRDLFPVPVSELSGGQVQRLLLARALTGSGRVLLLDEAMVALDARTRRTALQLLRDGVQSRQRFAIVVSHQLPDLARVADRIGRLADGQLAPLESAAQWLTQSEPAIEAGDAACAILAGRYAGVRDGLQALRFDGEELWLAADDPVAEGSPGRVCVSARDVSLTLSRASDTSILNRLPVRVVDEVPIDAAHVLLRLDCGQQRLLARITRRSRDELALKPGQAAWAQIKAASIY